LAVIFKTLSRSNSWLAASANLAFLTNVGLSNEIRYRRYVIAALRLTNFSGEFFDFGTGFAFREP
jgi:hypothetical protein